MLTGFNAASLWEPLKAFYTWRQTPAATSAIAARQNVMKEAIWKSSDAGFKEMDISLKHCLGVDREICVI